jgi:uncharacterized damage-inducible protein DinB
MESQDTREVWQRGPVEGVPGLLQPVAHALLQALEETVRYTENFPEKHLWEKPADLASVGFHLLHIRGVIDRLFTYARGEGLSVEQLKSLSAEQHPSDDKAPVLIEALRQQIHVAISQLKDTDENTLLERRTIGRKQIPTTVLGLLFHAAEHTQRHVGQLLVTSKIQQF